MRKFVIMGVQGSGKGTQAKLMADELDLVHISVGDVFRWNVQNHTKIGAQVRRIVASGHLVGDDLVESVVRTRLTEHDWNYGFIIDGFPRNARQAEFFLESYDIDGVIYLDLPDEEVVRRVLARRLCSRCGLDYNLIASRPRVEDTCDVCGGALTTRSDDNPEALAVRLSEYHAKTRPVMEIFQRKEHVAVIDARRSVLEVQSEIREHFDLPSPRSLAARPGGRPDERTTGGPGEQAVAAEDITGVEGIAGSENIAGAGIPVRAGQAAHAGQLGGAGEQAGAGQPARLGRAAHANHSAGADRSAG